MFQEPEKIQLCSPRNESPVRVFTEWDPLEEVIVGTIDENIRVPEWDPGLAAVTPQRTRDFFIKNQTRRFPRERLLAAKKEVDFLATLLRDHGVIVRRPGPMDQHRPVVTPYFSTSGGFHSAMPRDGLFAIGDLMIETPMAWRSRYFETFPFRDILKDYFLRGARWVSAPKPMLPDELWKSDHDCDSPKFESVVNEFEPVFDAADFMKLGKDIIGQRSHVTNKFGIEWLKQALGSEYNISIYEFDDAGPMHIDTTILPLGPGKVLVNKVWVSKLPDLFKNWDVFYPPESTIPDSHPLYMTSKWIHTNVLMLDESRVIVEAGEEPLIKAFESWGFKTIKCPFQNFQSFGGSFHCATLDVRRRGELRSYR